jgi:hypothetical protein
MHFQPAKTAGVLKLDEAFEGADDIGVISVEDTISVSTVIPLKPGGSITWNNPIVTGPSTSRVT